MNLNRCGAQKFNRWKPLFDCQPSLYWDEKEHTLTLEARNVKEPNTTASYNYELKLGIEDINLILDFLGRDPLEKSAQKISAGIATSNPALLRLLLSSFISDFQALRCEMTTTSANMAEGLREVQNDLRTLHIDVKELQSRDYPGQENEDPTMP